MLKFDDVAVAIQCSIELTSAYERSFYVIKVGNEFIVIDSKEVVYKTEVIM